MLLARERVAIVEAVERLAGMQAQEPKPPFVGLWTRVEGFTREDLHEALHDRAVVRATMMRGTLHLMSARHYAAQRACLQPVMDGARRVLGDRAEGLELDKLLPVARGLLEAFPHVNERALGFMVRNHLPLAMVPTGDRWAFPGAAEFTLAEPWLGAPLSDDATPEGLVRSYLAAFGPATAADFQTWSGLRGGKDVLDRLRPRLRVFRDERGLQLFDLPEAPRSRHVPLGRVGGRHLERGAQARDSQTAHDTVRAASRHRDRGTDRRGRSAAALRGRRRGLVRRRGWGAGLDLAKERILGFARQWNTDSKGVRMATAERQARVLWEGSLQKGSGELEFASSGIGKYPVTWASRVERPDGRTSPEELLAASHSACYAMALSATLGRTGNPPERLDVTATVSLDATEGGGFEVTSSALEVRGVVPGLDQAGFQAVAEEAEKGCPISNALRNNLRITVNATLES